MSPLLYQALFPLRLLEFGCQCHKLLACLLLSGLQSVMCCEALVNNQIFSIAVMQRQSNSETRLTEQVTDDIKTTVQCSSDPHSISMALLRPLVLFPLHHHLVDYLGICLSLRRASFASCVCVSRGC